MRYSIRYPPIGRPFRFVGALQLRSTEPFPELFALKPVGAPAKPDGVTVTVRD